MSESPLHSLEKFIEHKSAQLERRGDHGGLFEFRLIRRLVERARATLATLFGGAKQIDTDVAALRAQVARDLAPTDDTPGILDPVESSQLLHRLTTLRDSTTHHTATLGRLV